MPLNSPLALKTTKVTSKSKHELLMTFRNTAPPSYYHQTALMTVMEGRGWRKIREVRKGKCEFVRREGANLAWMKRGEDAVARDCPLWLEN
jgi:hypothetical protein